MTVFVERIILLQYYRHTISAYTDNWRTPERVFDTFVDGYELMINLIVKRLKVKEIKISVLYEIDFRNSFPPTYANLPFVRGKYAVNVRFGVSTFECVRTSSWNTAFSSLSFRVSRTQ